MDLEPFLLNLFNLLFAFSKQLSTIIVLSCNILKFGFKQCCSFSDKNYDVVFQHEVKVCTPRKLHEWNKLLTKEK